MSKKRSVNPGRILTGFAAVLAIVLAAGFVVVQFVLPRLNGPIDSVTFSQSQSLPDFDGAERTISDRAELEKLEALLDQYNVTPGLALFVGDQACTGGIQTSAEISYEGGRVAPLDFYDCSESGAFVEAASSLFSSWRTATE